MTTKLSEKIRTETRQPKKVAVIIHNDDYTSMEFVISLLRAVFNKTEHDSRMLAATVHLSGRGVAGVYPQEIAEEKLKESIDLATSNSQPLRLTLEEI